MKKLNYQSKTTPRHWVSVVQTES